MALGPAFLGLRAELIRLGELLRAVRREARSKCPDREHCVPTRIYDSGPELRGLLRAAGAAAGLAVTAVEVGGAGAVPRAMLTRCDRAIGKLRRRFRECVPGAARTADLEDLPRQAGLTNRQRRRWQKWVDRVRPAVRVARRQFAVVRSAVASCWRELATAPPAAGITITNVAVGNQAVPPRHPPAQGSGS
jgi:hypothetical protein